MRKLLTSNKGSSSILVVLLLIVLVVFGVAALTTALSSLRLGQKAADWTEAYYAAEAQAQRCFAEIDAAVLSAFEAGGNVADGIPQRLSELAFSTQTEQNGTELLIDYETRQGDVRLSATLALSLDDPTSLHIVRWQKLQ